MAMANRHTLSLYRQIFRMARTWQAIDPAETAAERIYIQNEARQLFKANKAVTDADSLRACQCEAEERIELALHYRNPYPRMPCVAPGAVSKAKKTQKRQDRLRRQSLPSYLRSYDPDA